MKHKILISTDRGGNGPEFLKEVKSLLNISHDKFLTGISISNYLEKKLILANGRKSNTTKTKTAEANVEFEISLEEEARRLDMHFNMLKGDIDDTSLSTLSSVADLLIIDRRVLQKFCGEDILAELVRAVVCPVLILPANKKIQSLVMVHDGTLSSVHAVKHFISLFNQDLRNLPASVLVSDPENKKDIQGEKVFIDYVKLFFKDIGIQLMDDEPVNCLIKNIQNTSSNPILIVGETGGNDILNCTTENRIITDSAPTFIFKHARS